MDELAPALGGRAAREVKRRQAGIAQRLEWLHAQPKVLLGLFVKDAVVVDQAQCPTCPLWAAGP